MTTATYEPPTGVPIIEATYQVLPPPTLEEYLALDKSIFEHGVTVPIVKDINGNIIDGHYRNEIAIRYGKECPFVTSNSVTDPEKTGEAISLNVNRRHLNSDQKRKLLAQSIKAQPELSDREHAKRTGTSPSTAGNVRGGLEESGEVSKLDTHIDKAGTTRPAKKKAPAKKAPAAPKVTAQVATVNEIGVYVDYLCDAVKKLKRYTLTVDQAKTLLAQETRLEASLGDLKSQAQNVRRAQLSGNTPKEGKKPTPGGAKLVRDKDGHLTRMTLPGIFN